MSQRPFLRVCFLLAGLAGMLTFCGCRTSFEEARAARVDVISGAGMVAEGWATRMAESTVNRKLGNLELSRLKMLKGDFAGSARILGPQLDELFTETHEGPVLKKEQIGGNILAGTLADDRAIPYELPVFELLFGLQYQALNSLFLGNQDNARVYLRRATAVQDQLKEENGALAPQTTTSTVDTNSVANAQNAATAAQQISAKLDAVAAGVRAAYENPLAWYLMGLLFEKENDASNAAIAYGEAAKLNPALRPLAAPTSRGGTDVVLVYEEGLIDMREPIKIPLPFGGTIWSVDFPVYNAPARPPARIAVEVGGAVTATCVPAVNVQALAYRDLKDRIPGIATRNVTRAAVKIAAQQVAYHSASRNDAGAAIAAGVLLFNAVSTAINEADTRAWQTLPEHVHLARFSLPAETKSIVVRNAVTGRAMTVPVAEGGTRLVWISDVWGYATVQDAPVASSGTATWARTTSLLNL